MKLMISVVLLGLGVQSTAMYFMSSKGELPRADYAIFCDLGAEGTATYNYLEYLLKWQAANNGIPVIVNKERNLYADLTTTKTASRFTSIPSFVKNEDGSVGMLKRQCTGEYKIKAADNIIRDVIYNIGKGKRRPKTKVWLGITLDEMERLSIPQESWKINVYPFIDYQINYKGMISKLSWSKTMYRADLKEWYQRSGFPVPEKSACVFCPYQSDRMWGWRKQHYPDDFAASVQVDRSIRDSRIRGIHNMAYLHRSCTPLEEVEFNRQQELDWGECSGVCHT